MSSNPATPVDNELAASDLGPLAWVLDELRKSLDGATKALRRFVRDAELARGSNLAELDASHLRIARQQLHQAVGALEMVGLGAPAKMLRAMEALAQKFVQRPELCSEEAATRVERASFALTEYLEGVLKGKTASPVALFPQYRAVAELAGAESTHPADLWPVEWRWIDVPVPADVVALSYTPALRGQLDQAVLRVMRTGDAKSANRLSQQCVGLAAGQSTLEPRAFWMICAGFFEGIALGVCPVDVYIKRAASRVLRQFASLAGGDLSVSERLAHDLVFFCSVAVPGPTDAANALNAVRVAYGLVGSKSIHYETEQFGRFDPALMMLARKRIAAAAETWSALAGGDTNRLKVVLDQLRQAQQHLGAPLAAQCVPDGQCAFRSGTGQFHIAFVTVRQLREHRTGGRGVHIDPSAALGRAQCSIDQVQEAFHGRLAGRLRGSLHRAPKVASCTALQHGSGSAVASCAPCGRAVLRTSTTDGHRCTRIFPTSLAILSGPLRLYGAHCFSSLAKIRIVTQRFHPSLIRVLPRPRDVCIRGSKHSEGKPCQVQGRCPINADQAVP